MVEREDYVSSMRRQVGWFVILGVGALLLVLLVASMRSNVFAKKFYIFFSPPSAASFYEGQPVKFQGFAIGRVDQIELQEAGKVRVTLELIDRYRSMLHQDAVVRVTKEGLIGEQVVEVTAGDEKMSAVKDGAVLRHETEASLDQLLIDLKPAVGNANVLLSELVSLAKWMNDPKGDVRVALAGFSEFARGVRGEHLEAILKHLQEFTKELDEQHVALELSNSLKATTKILEDIHPLSEAIGQDGAETAEHVKTLLINVDALTKALNIVASDLSELTPELPGLARESRETINEIKQLIKNLQGSWLVGGNKSEDDGQEAVTAPPSLDFRP